MPKMTALLEETNLSNIFDEEMIAKDLIERGEIDQAIAIFEQITPESSRILRLIGTLYAQRKGDYELAIIYYQRALEIQDEENEDTCGILTEIGFVHQNRGEFDLALIHHLRALNLRRSFPIVNPVFIANSLFGLASAYCGQKNIADALNCAQQALILNESVPIGNESNIAASLAILANIYHYSGDDIRALEFAKRALTVFEHCVPANPFGLISVLNNIGTIQSSAGLFKDALATFIRVSHICREHLPEDHPKRLAVDENVQRIANMQREDIIYSVSQFWTFLPKILHV